MGNIYLRRPCFADYLNELPASEKQTSNQHSHKRHNAFDAQRWRPAYTLTRTHSMHLNGRVCHWQLHGPAVFNWLNAVVFFRKMVAEFLSLLHHSLISSATDESFDCKHLLLTQQMASIGHGLWVKFRSWAYSKWIIVSIMTLDFQLISWFLCSIGSCST